MNVHLRLYSVLRDCLPSDSEGGRATVSLPDGSTLADLVIQLGIHQRLGCEATQIASRADCLVTVDGRFAFDMGEVLQDKDHVTIFPVMVGG